MLAVAGNAQQAGTNQDSSSTTVTVDSTLWVSVAAGLAVLLVVAAVVVAILLKKKNSAEDALVMVADAVVSYQAKAAAGEAYTNDIETVVSVESDHDVGSDAPDGQDGADEAADV